MFKRFLSIFLLLLTTVLPAQTFMDNRAPQTEVTGSRWIDYNQNGNVLNSGLPADYKSYRQAYRNNSVKIETASARSEPENNDSLSYSNYQDQGVFVYTVKVPPMPKRIYYYVYASTYSNLHGTGKKGFYVFFSPIKKQHVEYQLQRKFNKIIHEKYPNWPKINQGEIITNGFATYTKAEASKRIAIHAYETQGFKIKELVW